MKFLITGGCGFAGSNLAHEVIKRNEELYVLDNFHRKGSRNNLEWLKTMGDFTFYHADIRNNDDVVSIIKKVRPDAIFHLSGQVAMTTSIVNPRLDFEVNVIGTYNVIEAVRKYSPETMIIYSSTNKVYGDFNYLTFDETEKRYLCKEYPDGFDETLPLEFHSPYGCSKGAADQYLLDSYRIYGIKTVVLRHSTMYGGRQFATNDQGWIGWFCQKAVDIEKGILQEPFTISGTGKQVRDLLHSDDIVSLYFNIVKNIEKAKGEVFNIGGSMKNSLSIIELFDLLESELNIKMDYKKISFRESDQKVFVADISKVNQRLKWVPKIDKLQGLKKMIEWIYSIAI